MIRRAIIGSGFRTGLAGRRRIGSGRGLLRIPSVGKEDWKSPSWNSAPFQCRFRRGFSDAPGTGQTVRSAESQMSLSSLSSECASMNSNQSKSWKIWNIGSLSLKAAIRRSFFSLKTAGSAPATATRVSDGARATFSGGTLGTLTTNATGQTVGCPCDERGASRFRCGRACSARRGGKARRKRFWKGL